MGFPGVGELPAAPSSRKTHPSQQLDLMVVGGPFHLKFLFVSLPQNLLCLGFFQALDTSHPFLLVPISLALLFLCPIRCVKTIPMDPRPLERGAAGGRWKQSSCLGREIPKFLSVLWQLLGQDPSQLPVCPCLGHFWLWDEPGLEPSCFHTHINIPAFPKAFPSWSQRSAFTAQEGISARQNLIAPNEAITST